VAFEQDQDSLPRLILVHEGRPHRIAALPAKTQQLVAIAFGEQLEECAGLSLTDEAMLLPAQAGHRGQLRPE
jgi:hypothetical protein